MLVFIPKLYLFPTTGIYSQLLYVRPYLDTCTLSINKHLLVVEKKLRTSLIYSTPFTQWRYFAAIIIQTRTQSLFKCFWDERRLGIRLRRARGPMGRVPWLPLAWPQSRFKCFAFFSKLRLLLVSDRWDEQIQLNIKEKNEMDSGRSSKMMPSCKWCVITIHVWI